jgi:hypothetical protein
MSNSLLVGELNIAKRCPADFYALFPDSDNDTVHARPQSKAQQYVTALAF